MCFPGAIKARYDKDDPSTWAHWQTAEQKSTEEGRMTNPFASDDGRYDSLSGREFAIQTQRGGRWGSSPTKPDLSKKQNFWNVANMDPGHSGTYYGEDSAWQAMRAIDQEWDHKDRLAEIKSRYSKPSVAGSGGSGRGYSSQARSGRGSAPSNGLGITSTADIISNRGAT